ncbi:MAG TPA: branched-chain amino acid ABC transporter, partial [Burkholderiaceae bacterium]|nr:branched-chain amino acid ABC transporter [Burkholderiaceae bacterium]
ILANGRMVHDMYLAEAKKPSESKGEWDIISIKQTIPGAQAYQKLSDSSCTLK